MGLHHVSAGERVLHAREDSALRGCWVQTLQMSGGFGVIMLLSLSVFIVCSGLLYQLLRRGVSLQPLPRSCLSLSCALSISASLTLKVCH